MNDSNFWSPVVIAVFSGLIGVIITSTVNLIIACKNRKTQSELTKEELFLKENIEFSKLAIDHTTMVVKQLIDWNISYNTILLLKKKLVIAETDKNKVEVYDLTNKISEFITDMSSNLSNLYIFVSDRNREEIDNIQNKLIKDLTVKGAETNNFLKGSAQIEMLSQVNTVILSEIGSLKSKIDSKVLKYLV